MIVINYLLRGWLHLGICRSVINFIRKIRKRFCGPFINRSLILKMLEKMQSCWIKFVKLKWYLLPIRIIQKVTGKILRVKRVMRSIRIFLKVWFTGLRNRIENKEPKNWPLLWNKKSGKRCCSIMFKLYVMICKNKAEKSLIFQKLNRN